ncbi:GDSL esterase/lipase At2g42990 [Sorghum bicolor]|uniref:GDSL esterase/lipase n=1 Tax=Sorghum bicolor TaxID=4558 RepID=C5WPW7_SORBI|nr:GDSL esterase/lipase At2g42990 [Sorghum bicolor]EER94394.1 hypothetical protein SORBI_3001G275400 [Sorghum bicolor]|eukprot:XP_002467396.1 GDSL esterase/lipase At2g42990 [Sorghum bicolor]
MTTTKVFLDMFLVLQLLLLLLLLRGAAADDSRVPAVIVFGDSTADTGNNNFIQTLLRGNYTPYGRDFAGGVATGRFSNGRLAADFVSQGLGLPPAVPAYLDPGHSIHQLASGVSFASAGSGFDDITAQIFSAVTLTQQIEHFKEYKEKLRRELGGAAANHTVASSLYLFSVGGSDYLGNYLLFPVRRYRFTLLEYEAYLVGAAEAAVRAVYALGARRVRLPGLPPLGCLPLQRTVNLAAPGDCNRWHNMVARRFNRGLRAMASRLSRELPGAQVVYVDVYRLLADVIATPWAYGFEDAVRGCCGTGYFETGVLCSLDNALTCRDADKYVFFDAVHPSQRAYKIIADAIVHAASHRPE